MKEKIASKPRRSFWIFFGFSDYPHECQYLNRYFTYKPRQAILQADKEWFGPIPNPDKFDMEGYFQSRGHTVYYIWYNGYKTQHKYHLIYRKSKYYQIRLRMIFDKVINWLGDNKAFEIFNK